MKKIESNLISLYDFLINYINNNGFPPSVREMAKALEVNSTCTIHYYLGKLEEQNKIKRNSNKNRAIEIIYPEPSIKDSSISSDKFYEIPLIGRVAAGEPIMAIENYEDTYMIPKKMFSKGQLFMLKVRGDSMIDAGILENDYIVVRKQEAVNNGEIAVAMHNGNVTVKTFYKEENRYRLQPQNPYMMPIYVNSVEILGKVVGVIRSY